MLNKQSENLFFLFFFLRHSNLFCERKFALDKYLIQENLPVESFTAKSFKMIRIAELDHSRSIEVQNGRSVEFQENGNNYALANAFCLKTRIQVDFQVFFNFGKLKTSIDS